MGKRITLVRSKLASFVDGLVQTKQRFEVITTKSSVIITHGGCKYVFTSSIIRDRDLWMFQNVKAAAKNHIPERLIEAGDPAYHQLNISAVPDVWGEGFCEIDVSAAYWTLAHKAGILTDKVYQAGEDLPRKFKPTRLAVLGALARRRNRWVYDSTDWIYQGLEYDPKLASVFYMIAEELGNYMGQALERCGRDGVCYWVDNLVCRTSCIDVVRDYLASQGLRVTVKPLNQCHFGQGSRAVRMYSRCRRRDTDHSSGVDFKTFKFPLRYTGDKRRWDGNTALDRSIRASRKEANDTADMLADALAANAGLGVN